MGSVSDTNVVSLFMMFLGSACFGVGYFLNYWLDFRYRPYGINSTVHEDRYFYGLWRVCHESTQQIGVELEQCSSLVDSFVPSQTSPLFTVVPEWYRAVQAMVSFGFIFTVASLILMLLYSCFTRLKTRKVLLLTTVMCGIAGVCTIVGVALFGGFVIERVDKTLLSQRNGRETMKYIHSWAFAFTTGGSILVLLAGLVLLYELKEV